MFELLNIVDEWQKIYHFDKGIIVFQNKENLTNIRLITIVYTKYQSIPGGLKIYLKR